MLLVHAADAVAKVIGMSTSGVESNVSGTLVDAQSLEALSLAVRGSRPEPSVGTVAGVASGSAEVTSSPSIETVEVSAFLAHVPSLTATLTTSSSLLDSIINIYKELDFFSPHLHFQG